MNKKVIKYLKLWLICIISFMVLSSVIDFIFDWDKAFDLQDKLIQGILFGITLTALRAYEDKRNKENWK